MELGVWSWELRKKRRRRFFEQLAAAAFKAATSPKRETVAAQAPPLREWMSRPCFAGEKTELLFCQLVQAVRIGVVVAVFQAVFPGIGALTDGKD